MNDLNIKKYKSISCTLLKAFQLHKTLPYSLFFIAADLEVQCGISAVPGRQTFSCGVTSSIDSVTCSFDGGPGEACSFPIEVGIDRFGTDSHTLDVTVVDVFGRSAVVSFNFSLTERE